jgi:hypothetical protein
MLIFQSQFNCQNFNQLQNEQISQFKVIFEFILNTNFISMTFLTCKFRQRLYELTIKYLFQAIDNFIQKN